MRVISTMSVRRPRHGSSSRLMSRRRPCLAPIGESSLSLSVLRSDSTTLDEPPYRGHRPINVGSVGGTFFAGSKAQRSEPFRQGMSGLPAVHQLWQDAERG